MELVPVVHVDLHQEELDLELELELEGCTGEPGCPGPYELQAGCSWTPGIAAVHKSGMGGSVG